MLDRIAQIALVVLGAVVLALLVLGLAVSCRPLSAGDPAGETATALAQTPFPPTFAPSPTPSTAPLPPSATPTPTVAGQAESGGGQPGSTATPEAGLTAPGEGASAPTTTQPGGAGSSGAGGAAVLAPGSTVAHVVSRGEWLMQIARCYGVAFEALSAANPLPNPNLIMPGQTLSIPNIGSQGAITGPPCVVAYTVVAGDTWESLAQRSGSTTAILQRANPGALTVGRSIWLPRKP